MVRDVGEERGTRGVDRPAAGCGSEGNAEEIADSDCERDVDSELLVVVVARRDLDVIVVSLVVGVVYDSDPERVPVLDDTSADVEVRAPWVAAVAAGAARE